MMTIVDGRPSRGSIRPGATGLANPTANDATIPIRTPNSAHIRLAAIRSARPSPPPKNIIAPHRADRPRDRDKRWRISGANAPAKPANSTGFIHIPPS